MLTHCGCRPQSERFQVVRCHVLPLGVFVLTLSIAMVRCRRRGRAARNHDPAARGQVDQRRDERTMPKMNPHDLAGARGRLLRLPAVREMIQAVMGNGMSDTVNTSDARG